MADKYINSTGLQTIKTWIESKFATIAALTTLSGRVDDIVAEGGEPNTIETVKVNNVPLVPDQSKAVNVPVPTATSELTNDGDGTSNFATEEYVAENGGKIDVIKVNGTAQTITAKAVDIAVPTNVSDLTNDSGFQTQAQVQTLIDDELADITGIDFQVVSELPATGQRGVIYLLHNQTSAEDLYDEYIWVTPTGGTAHYEKIGNTQTDLSNYWSMDDLQAMTVAEINAILNAA